MFSPAVVSLLKQSSHLLPPVKASPSTKATSRRWELVRPGQECTRGATNDAWASGDSANSFRAQRLQGKTLVAILAAFLNALSGKVPGACWAEWG